MVATRDVCSRSIAGSHKNATIGSLKTTVGTENTKWNIWNNVWLIIKSRHYFEIVSLVNTTIPYNADVKIVYQDYWNWWIWIGLLAFHAQVWHHLHIFIRHLQVTNCKHRGFWNDTLMERLWRFVRELWCEPAVLCNWDDIWNNFSVDYCFCLLKQEKCIRIYTHNNTVSIILYLEQSQKSRISSMVSPHVRKCINLFTSRV